MNDLTSAIIKHKQWVHLLCQSRIWLVHVLQCNQYSCEAPRHLFITVLYSHPDWIALGCRISTFNGLITLWACDVAPAECLLSLCKPRTNCLSLLKRDSRAGGRYSIKITSACQQISVLLMGVCHQTDKCMQLLWVSSYGCMFFRRIQQANACPVALLRKERVALDCLQTSEIYICQWGSSFSAPLNIDGSCVLILPSDRHFWTYS